MPSGYRGFGIEVTLDSGQNVICGGRYDRWIDMDNGPSEYLLEGPLSSHGFVAKYDKHGNIIWANSISSHVDDKVNFVVADHNGPIYAVGFFGWQVDFDPDTATEFVLSGDGQDGFVVKYDYDGGLLWAVSMGDEIRGIDLDTAGNVYVTGNFSDTIDIDPGSGVVEFISNGERDVFIAKLSPFGELVWAKHIGGDWGDDLAESIAVSEQGSVFASGSISAGVDLDPGPDTALYGVGVSQSTYILKLDESGELQQPWPIVIKGFHGITYRSHLAIDDQENLFVAGTLYNMTDFDPGPNTNVLYSNGQHDVFLAKYDSDMNYQWATHFGGFESDHPYGIDIDLSGNVYVCGGVWDTVMIGSGNDSVQLNSVGAMDGFYSKHNPDGELIWAKSFGSSKFDAAGGIAVDDHLDVYVTGHFNGLVDFDPGIGVYEVDHNITRDLFLLKLSRCASNTHLVTNGALDLCYGDSLDVSVEFNGHQHQWSNGDTTSSISINTEGDYYVTVIDTIAGCTANSDTISVSVNQFNIEIIDYQNQNLFEASFVASSYQWYLNGQAIPGANGQFHIPTESGTYWLVVTDEEGCEAISPILEYTFRVGVDEQDTRSRLKVFPNPVRSVLHIISPTSIMIEEVQVFDSSQRLVVSKRFENDVSMQIDLSELSSGVYTACFKVSGEVNMVSKIVKH